MKQELLAAIARIRRAMPRNGDAMLVCEELERRLNVCPTCGAKLRAMTDAERARRYRVRQKAAVA
jgi:hypothetical protein